MADLNQVRTEMERICEGVWIPDAVWTQFLEQEAQLNSEHAGDVSLTAVVGEILNFLEAQ